jgi:carbamoyl-phosphate synthase small subunit
MLKATRLARRDSLAGNRKGGGEPDSINSRKARKECQHRNRFTNSPCLVKRSFLRRGFDLSPMPRGRLILADGSTIAGEQFGAPVSRAGEVVFNTGMVGYPEAMTDPSYHGQILVLTYPLVGNYGVPVNGHSSRPGEPTGELQKLESDRIQISGLIVSTVAREYSHWAALDSLDSWLKRKGVPALCDVDTRALTKKLRIQGCMLGKLLCEDEDISWDDPNRRNLAAEVSVGHPQWYPMQGGRKVILVDLGCKESILRCLLNRGLDVLRVPWDFDWSQEEAHGIVLSNGPGDPKMCSETISVIRRGFRRNVPILGICLGHQLLALAAGADTSKMKYGHRGQNQPCVEVGTRRCFITSQNHGFAVNDQTLPPGWKPWFFNANDGTNEGMRHQSLPILSVQFHPEASPGPVDTGFVFNEFVNLLNHDR